jgi:hypothetical protein
MKIIIKYHIEIGEEVIEIESLEKAERRIKSMAKQEIDFYVYKTIIKEKGEKEVYLVS